VSVTEARSVHKVDEFEEVKIALSEVLIDGRLDIYPQIQKKRYFDVRLAGDHLAVSAGSAVGLIPLNERIAISVWPRVPLKNFAHVLSTAEGEAIPLDLVLRGFVSAAETSVSVLDALARGFATALEQIDFNGIHHEYRWSELDTSFPRGRILFGLTMQRHAARNISHTVTTGRFETTFDTPPNRLLRYVLRYLAARYARSNDSSAKKLLARLERLDHFLERVTIDHDRSFLSATEVKDPRRLPELFKHYEAAIRLGKAILQGRGLDLPEANELVMESHVFQLEHIFENYVRRVLTRELADLSPMWNVLDGNKRPGRKSYFNEPPSKDATPDVVIARLGHDARTGIVVEVKYIDRPPKREEENQAVAYAVSYGCPRALLVHPAMASTKSGVYRRNSIGPIALAYYALDLSAADLTANEREFAQVVRDCLNETVG
jgi:5-methylcytosine-specific restriction endonuclease McrBC regulatory subunit McrC